MRPSAFRGHTDGAPVTAVLNVPRKGPRIVRKRIYVAALAIAGVGGPVRGQMSAPPMVSTLPNVSTMTAANSAGVLEYCMRHHLVSKVTAGAILEKFASHGTIKSSADYQAGLSGQVRAGGGAHFMLGRAAGHLQSQVCDMVLDHSKRL